MFQPCASLNIILFIATKLEATFLKKVELILDEFSNKTLISNSLINFTRPEYSDLCSKCIYVAHVKSKSCFFNQ